MSEPVRIETTYKLREAVVNGERAVVVDVDIPDHAPQHVREGLARRAIVNAGGRCPCGARMVLPNREARRRAARKGRVIVTEAAHDDGCPALLRGVVVQDEGGWFA